MGFMSPLRSAGLYCLMVSALLLSGCAGQEVADDGQSMSISVDIRDVHRCSRISPEITVTDIPEGTHHFVVRLVASGSEERFLGGGTWPNDGSGVIPEGALTEHYRGPCPPDGQSGNYIFAVYAMREGSVQPLAVRVYHFTQE